MPDEAPTIRGRGAAENPPNRFERLHYEPDPDADPDERPAPETLFFRDTTRTILATNQSPDVGFEVSVNPYRGCEHGCVYCLSGDTPILMADGMTRPLADLRVGDEIYGTVRRGWYRRYIKSRVLAHWQVTKPAFRLTLQNGTCLITGGDHRFLTERGWEFVKGCDQRGQQRPYLTPNNKLMGIGAFAQLPCQDNDYKAGYLTGLIRGDGHLATYCYVRQGGAPGNQYQFRLALIDEEPLKRASGYLAEFGIGTRSFTFQEAAPGFSRLEAIRTHARGNVERVGE